MSKLLGNTVLVAGTPQSIVRATALGLAAAGAQVIQHGKDAKKPEAVVEKMRKAGARAGTLSADLADPDGPHKLAEQTRGIIGDRLDILVATMGTAKAATFEDTTTGDFDGMFAANVRAPFFLVASSNFSSIRTSHGPPPSVVRQSAWSSSTMARSPRSRPTPRVSLPAIPCG